MNPLRLTVLSARPAAGGVIVQFAVREPLPPPEESNVDGHEEEPHPVVVNSAEPSAHALLAALRAQICECSYLSFWFVFSFCISRF